MFFLRYLLYISRQKGKFQAAAATSRRFFFHGASTRSRLPCARYHGRPRLCVVDCDCHTRPAQTPRPSLLFPRSRNRKGKSFCFFNPNRSRRSSSTCRRRCAFSIRFLTFYLKLFPGLIMGQSVVFRRRLSYNTKSNRRRM